jgi:hypothetical protein
LFRRLKKRQLLLQARYPGSKKSRDTFQSPLMDLELGEAFAPGGVLSRTVDQFVARQGPGQ